MRLVFSFSRAFASTVPPSRVGVPGSSSRARPDCPSVLDREKDPQILVTILSAPASAHARARRSRGRGRASAATHTFTRRVAPSLRRSRVRARVEARGRVVSVGLTRLGARGRPSTSRRRARASRRARARGKAYDRVSSRTPCVDARQRAAARWRSRTAPSSDEGGWTRRRPSLARGDARDARANGRAMAAETRVGKTS